MTLKPDLIVVDIGMPQVASKTSPVNMYFC